MLRQKVLSPEGAAAPRAARADIAVMSSRRNQSPSRGNSPKGGKSSPLAQAATRTKTPTLANAAASRKVGGSPTASPATSTDRMQCRGTGFSQKAKGSASKPLRPTHDALLPGGAAAGTAAARRSAPGRAAGGARADASEAPTERSTESPTESPAESTTDSFDAQAEPAQLAVDVEEEEFVPEEEEEGPSTQGDHLMMRKAKMGRQVGRSPGGSLMELSPGAPPMPGTPEA